MRTLLSIAAITVLAAPAAAGLSSAVIDDFGSGGAGLGFVRQVSGGASVVGGQGLLPSGGGFSYVGDYNASAFTGISLKVTGDLSGGSLELFILGAYTGFVAMNVPLNGAVSNGYAWITFDQIDAAVGNEIGFISSSMAGGEGIGGIGLSYTGAGSIAIDDFVFASAPVPAPGALALLGLAGIAGSRRRR